jgi:hypothetical protein
VRKEETISRCPTTRKHLDPSTAQVFYSSSWPPRQSPRTLNPIPSFVIPLSPIPFAVTDGAGAGRGGGGVEELISRRQTLRKQLDVPDTQVCCSSSWSSGQSSPTRSSPRQVRKPGRSPDLSSATQSFLFSHRLPKPKCRTSSTQMQNAVCPVDLFLE